MYFSYSVLFGPGTSLVFASALIIVAKYFDKRRGVATGIVGSGESFGIMSLGPILQTLLDAFGWRHTCRIMSAVIFVICLLSCFYNPDLEYDHKPTHVEEIEPLQEQDSEENPLLQKGKNKMQLNIEVWKNPAFVKITLLAAMVKFGQFSPAIHLVMHGLSSVLMFFTCYLYVLVYYVGYTFTAVKRNNLLHIRLPVLKIS